MKLFTTNEKGGTLFEELKAWEQSSGERVEMIHFDMPECAEWLWNTFHDIRSFVVGNGMSTPRISLMDFKLYCEAKRIPMFTVREMKELKVMDEAFIAAAEALKGE